MVFRTQPEVMATKKLTRYISWSIVQGIKVHSKRFALVMQEIPSFIKRVVLTRWSIEDFRDLRCGVVDDVSDRIKGLGELYPVL
jgi:hypothetical protein